MKRCLCLVALAFPTLLLAKPGEVVVNNVRVQVLSPHLVRLEQKGPQGFEDRITFTVVDRNWPGARFEKSKNGANVLVKSKYFVVSVPSDGSSLANVKVLDTRSREIYSYSVESLKQKFLPSPGEMPAAYPLGDYPRLIPPSWGATPPPPDNNAFPDTSGWDTTNSAPDVYVFVPGKETYAGFRKEYLKLTGPTPMPPLFMFGFIDSRYHPYTESEALQSIDTYREKGIPLDMFVVDTDWRVNGSKGYDVETKYFPDMQRFITEAKSRGVHLMYNDHPEPQYPGAMDPKELQYRWNGLTSLMGMGMDVWWYDRNWSTVLPEPMPGIAKEVWGQRLFHDITARFRPDQRPAIMTNVEGIDNGFLNGPPHPAGHRFPIWWTGDTGALWPYLQRGVSNGVGSGVFSFLPYVNEDLGGHWGTPTPELYVRYLQFGCLAPITRVHCTRGEDRHPWAFGDLAEGIVTEYIKMRYRLLPTIYAAAHQNFVDGTPIMRRLDLEWPQYKEASDDTEFLLGDDILVAPIITSKEPLPEVLPSKYLQTPDGKPGLKGEYFGNDKLEGEPALVRIDPEIKFAWGGNAPAVGLPTDHFSARWTGKVGPMPTTATYRFATQTDDGVRLFIDGKKIVDQWVPQPDVTLTGEIQLEKGKTYDIRMEYFEDRFDADCYLRWEDPTVPRKKYAGRSLWIPPGTWTDAWYGERVKGPKTIEVQSPLFHTPMYVREGGIVMLAPEMQHTGEKPWDPVTLDVFAPSPGTSVERTFYEDDGLSNGYTRNEFRQTKLTVSRDRSGQLTLKIAPTKGTFAGALPNHAYNVRIYLPVGATVSGGNHIKVLHPKKTFNTPFPSELEAAPEKGGPVVLVSLPSASVAKAREVKVKFH